jgi:hypothetical protein
MVSPAYSELSVDSTATTSARAISESCPSIAPTEAETTHRMNFNMVPSHFRQESSLLYKHMYLILSPPCCLEALREVALLMHKMMTMSIVRTLWIIYRQSGTGELPSPVTTYRGDRRVWPLEVQSLTKERVESSNDEDNNDDACLRLVEHCLQDLSEQHQQCQYELSVKTRVVHGYTRIIEYALEKFVKQGLESLHVDIDRRRASVRYQYNDTLLKRAYLAENPNESQVSFSSQSIPDFHRVTL